MGFIESKLRKSDTDWWKRINYCNLFIRKCEAVARLILETTYHAMMEKKCEEIKLIMAWRVATKKKPPQTLSPQCIILIIFMRFNELILSLFLMNRCLQLSTIYDTYFTVSRRQSFDFKTKRFCSLRKKDGKKQRTNKTECIGCFF